MENFVERWLRRLIISTSMAVIAVLGMTYVALAVGTIVDFRPVATDTTISLTWTKSLSTDNTVIRYSTTTFPATALVGTSAYSGTGSYTSLTGLTAGTTYYFSAFAYDGLGYSAAKQLLVTTFVTVAENSTIPYAQPAIPVEAWQDPDTSAWSIHPIDDILTWFSDPTYVHGGLGMPTDNLVMFLAGLAVTFITLYTYIKWRNFFTSWTIGLILSFFCVSLEIMQGYIIGLEIIVGAGVWAVENSTQ